MINRSLLAERTAHELALFADLHPESALLAADADEHLLSGVPMPWMVRLPGRFPLFFARAEGARFVDVDGLGYVDFCLGDTGAMTGHAHPAVAEAVSSRSRRGITTMMPSEDSVWVSGELARRFGLPKWQFAMTATDANRFVLRFARALTGRPKIAVIDWCYHGTVDETLAVLSGDGRVVSRPGAVGAPVDPSLTTRVVPFNDTEALERELAHGDVACLLMEPAMTNIGIVMPGAGYLDAVREITRRHGVLLVIDETHTICAGPGGCTAEWGLQPDFLVIGKTIAGGIPAAVYGMSAETSERLEVMLAGDSVDVSGVGGTLTGNALSVAAVRATLSTSLTAADFARMVPLAEAWTEGVRSVYESRSLPWHVQRLGCRSEYWFSVPPVDGAAAAAAVDHELESYMHLFALNRGILLTPFHNMALFSPAHVQADVDFHTSVFAEAVDSLIA